MGPMQRLVYVFEGKDELTPVARKIAKTLKKTGEDGSKGFKQSMKNGLNTVGPMAASAIGVGLAFAVKSGMEMPISALKTVLKEAGTSFEQFKPQLDSTSKRMERMGFSNADTYKSFIALMHATGSTKIAIQAQGAVADLARVKHIGLADAAETLAKAADGSMRALKGMNVTTATGKDHASAMANAEKILADRVSNAGGIAKFAAANHMSEARAMELIQRASGGAQHAVQTLGAHDLTLAHATSLVTAAQNGSSKALQELRKHHLGAYQAQTLVEKATHGDIAALNELGITVLPKSATAAERMSQIQKVLNERIGGTAANAAKTFGGKLGVMKAQFKDIAAQVGLKILPVLSFFMTLILKVTGSTPLLIAFAAVIGAIAGAWIAVKIAAMIASDGMKTALIGSGIGAAVLLLVFAITLIITHWKTVKKIALEAIHAIVDVLKFAWNWIKKNWPLLLAILTGPFGLATLFIIRHWESIKKAAMKFIDWMRNAWQVLVKGLRTAFAWFVDKFFSFVGLILKGAARMMGWVPGVGGKLKKASDEFDKFHQRVNKSLHQVNDRTVNVGVKFKSGAFAAGHGVTRAGVQTGLKAGGPVRGPGTTTSDSIPALLSDDEYIVTAAAHRRYGTAFLDKVNKRKFAAGGATGGEINVNPKFPAMSAVNNIIEHNVYDMAKKWWRTHQGNGGAIVEFAKKFLGQVPYVWGGDSTSGWDCSGFVSYLYRHFNLMSGRNTAEGFRGWGRKVDTPMPGGMVFYGRPAFHIGLTADGNRTLEAGGGSHTPTWGTTSGNTGFAIPPHGFGQHGGGRGTGGQWGSSELANLWTSKGARGASYAAAIALAESGGNAGIVQSGQPPGLTGYGLWQITPTSGIWQNGRFGNLLNASNNADAAVYLYRQAGSRFTPWATFNSGAYQQFMSGGGPVARSFDRGYGVLKPGMNLAYNGTGRNEFLSTGGGRNYNINITASPTAHPADIGREVVTAIKQYEKRNGASWRKGIDSSGNTVRGVV